VVKKKAPWFTNKNAQELHKNELLMTVGVSSGKSKRDVTSGEWRVRIGKWRVTMASGE